MEEDRVTLARARSAIHEARKYLFEDWRRIQMVDYGIPIRRGQKLYDQRAIRFHVDEKLSFEPEIAGLEMAGKDPLPENIQGIQLDVIESVYTPQRNGNQRLRRFGRIAPLRGGISISDEWRNIYGTLGCLVVDRDTGEEMILSNWHVLIGDRAGRPGQRILQPGRLDGGNEEDFVAELVRHALALNMDAAVARLNGSRGAINDQFDFRPIRGVTRPLVGMRVIKSGRTTGITRGQIVGVGGEARMNYGFREALIQHVVTIESLESFSEYSLRGDSGSIVLVEDTQEAIGLHFAGNSFLDTGLAVDIRPVLVALNVDIVTRPPMSPVSVHERRSTPVTGQPEMVRA